MFKLYNKATNAYLGEISDEDLRFLKENLEEESLPDEDYYINKDTLYFLKEKGLGESAARMIETAMAQADDIEIRYEKG